MADNVNIIVQDTINDIVVNAAVVVETIDINVQVAVDEVQIIANPNNYVVNINRIIGEQVQSDWDQADDQAPDYIKNKPAIPTNTSDLTNDGEDGVNPFITAADIPASLLVALPFTTDHLTATNNAYVIGDVVWYLGNVYRCIANNDSILPTSTTYWTNLGAGNPLVEQPTDWNSTSGNNQILNKPTIPTGTVTSVGLTMPSAFTVTNSPITSSGDIAVTGAGVVSQYVRGDGSLANFPTSTGGGASLSFYLNGSVSQGTIGGVAFREMDRTPILGAGTDFTIAANGYIQSFITDANVPNQLEIPAGNWNFETYFSASSGGGSPSFYVELYKWNGATLSLIASNSATPEGITNGAAIDAYFSALAVPQTTLLATDRLAIRIYVTHSGRTIKLHTEDNHLCQVVTTFSTGLTALNGLTTQVQSFATGTSGTDFAISSATSTHTFNLPTASAANRGALSSTDWTTFNGKFTLPALTSGSVLFSNGTTIAQDNANLFWDDTNNRLGIGTNAPTSPLTIVGDLEATNLKRTGGTSSQFLKADGSVDSSTYQPLLTNPVTGTGTSGQVTFWNGTSSIIGSSNFTFSNDRLTINRTSDSRIFLQENGVTNLQLQATSGISRLSSNNGNLALATGGGDRLLAFLNGNIAINTTTDAGFKLDVNGTARVSGNATFGTLGTGTGMFWDNTNNRLGIGTISPTTLLDVNGVGTFMASNTPTLLTKISGSYGQVITMARNGAGNNVGIGVAQSGELGFYTNNVETMRIHSNGSLLMGTTTNIGSSKLTIESTTQGFLPPRMTTTQKNAIATPAAGLVVYDTTLGKLCVRGAAAWETITSI